MGTAKPMPALSPESVRIWVLMPIDPTLAVDEGAAGVARVDGGVGLDHRHDVLVRARHRPVDGAHDALGDGLVEAEGAADGDDDGAHLGLVVEGQGGDGHVVGRVDLDHGHVVVEVGAQHRAVAPGAVGQAHVTHVEVADAPAVATPPRGPRSGCSPRRRRRSRCRARSRLDLHDGGRHRLVDRGGRLVGQARGRARGAVDRVRPGRGSATPRLGRRNAVVAGGWCCRATGVPVVADGGASGSSSSCRCTRPRPKPTATTTQADHHRQQDEPRAAASAAPPPGNRCSGGSRGGAARRRLRCSGGEAAAGRGGWSGGSRRTGAGGGDQGYRGRRLLVARRGGAEPGRLVRRAAGVSARVRFHWSSPSTSSKEGGADAGIVRPLRAWVRHAGGSATSGPLGTG